MTIDEQEPKRPAIRIGDHPEPLASLLQPFDRRRIAAAIDGDGRLVLVRPDELLVVVDSDTDRDVLAERVGAVDAELADRVRKGSAVTSTLLKLTLAPSRPSTGDGPAQRWEAAPVGRAVALLESVGAQAMPNYVLLGSQGIKGNPVGAEAHFVGGMMFTAATVETPTGIAVRTTADPAGPPAFLRQPLKLGPRPRVLVADTGLCTTTSRSGGLAPAHPELAGVAIHGDWARDDADPLVIDDEDEPDGDGLGYLDFEAGHGTFIAGIVRQICPDAEIETRGVLSSFGDGDVEMLLMRLATVPKISGPFDLVVLSLGGYMSEADAQLFGDELSVVLGDALAIAAAGNQATSRPYYPAALPGVVAVGGLGEDGRAWFSNFGGWVDACAPAIDVISTFFAEADEPDGPQFRGWARWSGTSFAAPKVAAALAQEMVLTGSTAADAWRRLSDYQRLRVPDLGTVFNL